MELKYKTSDTEKLVYAFAKISEHKNDLSIVAEEMKKLMIEYPPKIIETFLHCIEIFENKYDEDYLKDNYMGVIGYITLRLNFAQ